MKKYRKWKFKIGPITSLENIPEYNVPKEVIAFADASDYVNELTYYNTSTKRWYNYKWEYYQPSLEEILKEWYFKVRDSSSSPEVVHEVLNDLYDWLKEYYEGSG